MVIVSHDRHLLRTSCDQLLLVNDGRVDEFKDDLDAYPRWLAEQRRKQSSQDAPAPESSSHSAGARKERKRQEAERRRQQQPLRNRLRELEHRLERLSARQSKLEDALGQPDIYADTNRLQLRNLLTEKGEVDRQLSDSEEEWLQTSEQLESA